MASSDFSVADKLDEAMRLIERGWVQMAFSNENGVCILGALNRTDGIGVFDAMGEVARKLLTDAVGGVSLMSWNDADGRTKDEVLAAFRKAIDLARGAEIVTPSEWTKLDAYLTDIEMARA